MRKQVPLFISQSEFNRLHAGDEDRRLDDYLSELDDFGRQVKDNSEQDEMDEDDNE